MSEEQKMTRETKLIKDCIKNKKRAQKALYLKYAPIMRAVCLRYAGNLQEAEDVLQEGFIKVFTKIKNYSEKGSFEGWIRKIMINTALTQIRSNKKYKLMFPIEDVNETNFKDFSFDKAQEEYQPKSIKEIISAADFDKNEIMEIVASLPDGYRMVFNLYTIEQFKHKEIAELLGIDINTSKSQLSRARKLIQQKLYEIATQKKNRQIQK